ncbi:DMT family transporter [Maridesulfovibrio sp.]|uniref:DMT family transporter n=1 Tax=Maridesulfovibrio sp. TaxID=2795000 RepID=UPI002A18848F|nr:DMT family transporter [Maridesulfovibrio sp.]
MLQTNISRKRLSSGVIYALLGALCFGTTGTLQALTPEGSQPLVVGTMRLLVGGLIMLPWVKLTSGFTKKIPWPKRATLMATAGLVLFQLCFFVALRLTGVAVGTVIAIGSAPIIGGLIDFFFRGITPGKTWSIATLLSIFGLTMLSFDANVKLEPLGMFTALGAGAGYAIYAANSQIILANRSAQEMMAMIFCIGGMAMSPLLLINDISWMASIQGATSILLLGTVSSAIAFCLFATGLATLSLSTGLTLGLAEPLVAAMLGILFLGEPCSMQSVLGIFIIFSGMFVMTRTPSP